jgi:hypothetical protein
MSKGNRKMPPDTYRCPDMVNFRENTLGALSCPDIPDNFGAHLWNGYSVSFLMAQILC